MLLTAGLLWVYSGHGRRPTTQTREGQAHREHQGDANGQRTKYVGRRRKVDRRGHFDVDQATGSTGGFANGSRESLPKGQKEAMIVQQAHRAHANASDECASAGLAARLVYGPQNSPQPTIRSPWRCHGFLLVCLIRGFAGGWIRQDLREGGDRPRLFTFWNSSRFK